MDDIDKNNSDSRNQSNFSQESENKLYKPVKGTPENPSINIIGYMELDSFTENGKDEDNSIVEVMFKGNRRELFKNDKSLRLKQTDLVIVEVDNGIDAGILTNCCVNTLKRIKNLPEEELPNSRLIRNATTEDKKKYKKNDSDCQYVVTKSRELVKKHELNMKVTEAEWQFDRQRLTIYFTAPQRIDFREMVKDLARLFKTRIELRQISTREQTRRLGNGIGPCGKSLCCTTFMNDFRHITFEHAKIQQLAGNVSKLSGNCGRLKCCLLYEYESYVKAFEKYPPPNTVIETKNGVLKITKVDIFNEKTTLMDMKSGAFSQLDGKELLNMIKSAKVTYPDSDENSSENSEELRENINNGDCGNPDIVEKNEQKKNDHNKNKNHFNNKSNNRKKGNYNNFNKRNYNNDNHPKQNNQGYS